MASIPLPALQSRAPEAPDMLGQLGKLQQLKNVGQQGQIQQQTIQENQLQLQLKQQQMKDQQTIQQVASQYEGGLSNPQALKDLSGKISAATYIPLQKSITDQIKDSAAAHKDELDNRIKVGDAMLGLIAQAKQLPPDQYAQSWPQIAQKAAEIDPRIANHVNPEQPIPQQGLDSIALGYATHTQIDSQEAAKRAQATLEETKRHNQATEATAGGVEGRELKDYLADSSIDADKNKNAATFAQWKAKQSPSAVILNNQLGGGGEGTPLRQAAQRYLQSGELPSGFARSPGTMTAILKEANAIDPNANIAGNKAIYGANKKALGDLQDQFSKVTAFENTAIKNLDQVLAAGKQIPDLGVRFANTPIRAISEKMIGTPAMAKFKAALVTAQTEAAKVLNSATGSGVLSDSARHELEGLLSGSLPYPAMEAAINQLKTDMGNRHQSYQDEIGNLQQAVGGSPTQAPASNSGNPFAQFGGKPR